MLARWFKRLLKLGVLGGAVYAAAKKAGALPSQRTTTPPAVAPRDLPPKPSDAWPPLEAVPAADELPAKATTALLADPDAPVAPAPAAVEPVEGACPASHPVKGKLNSKIFHLPGMLNYDRTTPDRCYVDADSAEADGLRAAKR